MLLKLTLLFVTTLLPFEILAQHDLKFRHISTDRGLSQSVVQCIFKDSRGFMWFGTRDGLNRYDGYTFTIFNNDRKKGNISNNFINVIIEDNNHDLWIGTANGLNKYSRKLNEFTSMIPEPEEELYISDILQDSRGNKWVATRNGVYVFGKSGITKIFKHDPLSENSISSNWVDKIVEDPRGDFWLATQNGLDVFHDSDGTFTHYRFGTLKSQGQDDNYVTSLFIDKNKTIWVGTDAGGLYQYNQADDSFINFKENPAFKEILSDETIKCFSYGPGDNELWLGTENGGIMVYSHVTNTFKSYKHNPDYEGSLSDNSIRSLYRDDLRNMWVGTYSKGINMLSSIKEKFGHVKSLRNVKNSLLSSVVKSIVEDRDGFIWIGTDGGGISCWDRKKNVFTHFAESKTRSVTTLSNLYNHCSIEVNQDTLAFGYHRGGLDLLDRKTGKVTHYIYDPKNPDGISHITVSCLYKGKENKLWIGTWHGGLNVLDLTTKKFKVYKSEKENSNTLSSNLIYTIKEDDDGNMWIGTEEGLNLFDKTKDSFTRFYIDNEGSDKTAINTVISIHIDKKNNVWIGTFGGGLNLLNKKRDGFTTFTTRDGLPNNVINSMLEDSHGNLWISTNKGLSMFDPKTKKFRNFGIEDGVQSSEFKRNSCYKTSTGEMFFGGINGLNSFHPDSLKENKITSHVVFTGFQIFNIPVNVNDKNSPLTMDISETKEIKLSYQQSVFTFQFASLDFNFPEKNQYAYILVGFDKDWNYVGNERKATYTNLDPGTYTFKVKAANSDGFWNERDTSIDVMISPPFWKTSWFIAMAVALSAGSVILWYRARINAINRQKELLENQVEERTEQLSQANANLTKYAETLQEANQKINTLFSEIKDSIKAAQSIQNSILPLESTIKKHLSESFILYKPKDVVSGDFYWFDIAEGKIILAVVDCIGHGVSGAFMSINAYQLLNQRIYSGKSLQAGKILDDLNYEVTNAHREHENRNIENRMDIALCIIDPTRNKLQYAGANSPLYIVQHKSLSQFKPNKISIGTMVQDTAFETHEITIEKNDMIYLFTDGYPDQLGGPSGMEKFKYQPFRDLLLNCSGKTMSSQSEMLTSNLNTWMGQVEQTDDILVIGFRV